MLPKVVPSFEIVRYSVAIQFTVHKLSATLGSASRDDDRKRFIFHKVNTLKKRIDERLRNGGNLHAAAHDGKYGLFGFLPVLILGFGVDGPFVDAEGQALFVSLYTAFLSVVSMLVRMMFIIILSALSDFAHPVLMLNLYRGYSPVNAYVSRETQALAR